jgi:microcystin-dependent protein
MGQTPNLSLPYPELGDSADVPRDIKALADALDAQSVIPAGVIQMWPDAAAPNGWLLCQGQPVPAASNPGLAAIFGTAGGNVTLPDLRGRALIGAAPVNVPASGDPARALRSTGGLTAVKLTSVQSGLPAHQHLLRSFVTGGATNGSPSNIPHPNEWGLQTGVQFVNPSNEWSTNTGRTLDPPLQDAASTHENMPPYYAINFIIKAG